MMLKLKSTSKEFELSDPSGYSFKIVVEQEIDGDRNGSWGATVTFSSRGVITDEYAVEKLLDPAEHFIRMLKDAAER